MSDYVLSALNAADAELARTPGFGYDFTIHVSPGRAIEVGTLTITGANTVTWEAEASALTALDAVPAFLQVHLTNDGLASAADVAFTLTGTDQAAASETWTATIAQPAWISDSQRVFRLGQAAEFIASPATNKVKTLTGGSPFTVTCNADATGAVFKVYALPARSTFKMIGCTTGYDYTDPVAPDVSIACGRKATAYTRKGLQQEGRLSINAKQANLFTGLQRYAGIPVCVLVEVRSGGSKNLTALHVHRNVSFAPKLTAPDGQSEVTSSFEAPVLEPFLFPAP